LTELFPPAAYERDDESADARFYSVPRKVVHIDDGAIAALGRVYERVLPARGRLLDLMSSWRSHLPYALEAEVVGLGLNAEEMADNPQLARHIVHDVNDETAPLPFEDETFDGGMCAVSIQYVTRPVRVFREVRRILNVGAPFVVSFSNRCFPTKAVAVWLNTTDAHHVELVQAYFEAGGGWTKPVAENRSPGPDGDPLFTVWARRV
jgi:SAM-dependent methyltransferase